MFGACGGAFAEFVCGPADRFVRKPEALSFEHAATLATSGLTAVQRCAQGGGQGRPPGARHRRGRRRRRVQRAAGAGAGATVTGVCSTGKIDLVRALGAEDVIDYTRTGIADGGRRWDVIVDTAGANRPLSELRRALAPRRLRSSSWAASSVALARGPRAAPWRADPVAAGRAAAAAFFASGSHADLEHLAQMAQSGRLRATIDRTYALADVPGAIRYCTRATPQGKSS
ncbi:MAG: zinc-binding dehydrogenase [Vicinamibacterales bacterium]